jgi:hypothetical protein
LQSSVFDIRGPGYCNLYLGINQTKRYRVSMRVCNIRPLHSDILLSAVHIVNILLFVTIKPTYVLVPYRQKAVALHLLVLRFFLSPDRRRAK